MADIWLPHYEFRKNILERELKYIGLNIFDPAFTFNFMRGFYWLQIVLFTVNTGYNIKLFYGYQKQLCFVLVTAPFVIFLAIRFYKIQFKRKKLLELVDTTHEIYKGFTEEEIDEKILFRNYGEWIKKIAVVTSLLVYVTGFACFMVPGIIYLVNQTKTLQFGFVIPGISYEEGWGYAINYAWQTSLNIMVILAYLPSFHLFTLYVGLACFQLDALVIKLKRFNEGLIETWSKSNQNSIPQLKRFIGIHQKIKNFTLDVDSIYATQNMFDITCIGFQCVMTLFFATTEFWAIGYIIVFAVVVPLLIQCTFGVTIEIKGENLVREIYELQWHLLTPKERKMIVIFMANAQRTNFFTFARFLPVNLETFAKATRLCFNILMFLLKRHKL